MALKIPDGGLQLGSSTKAGLPSQAFAIMLDESMVAEMIAHVNDGGDIQLALGNSPAFLFDHREIMIPELTGPSEFELYHTGSATAKFARKLQHGAMSIRDQPKRARQLHKAETKAPVKTGGVKKTQNKSVDAATTQLKNAMAKAQQDKREQSTRLVDGVVKTSKGIVGRGGRLLGSQTSALPVGSSPMPELPRAASKETKHEDLRFIIMHELAAQDFAFDPLEKLVLARATQYDEITTDEFKDALYGVAKFDDDVQGWRLKGTEKTWKGLDVYEYKYSTEELRQKAIDNAVKYFDSKRLSADDPAWQKLLPASQRGKGICISKLQERIMKAQQPAPRINVQKPDGSPGSGSPSGIDSEKDLKGAAKKGGKTKKAVVRDPIKRMIANANANNKKPAAAVARASPKPSPRLSPKDKESPAKTAPKAAAGKFKSKEFVSPSDSDEVPLAERPRVKPAAAVAKTAQTKPAPKSLAPEKVRAPAPKAKPAVRTPAPPKTTAKATADTKAATNTKATAKANDAKAKNTVGVARPQAAKRAREEDEDSAGSGSPVPAKRHKAKEAVRPAERKASAAPTRQIRPAASAAAPSALARNRANGVAEPTPLAASPPAVAAEKNNGRRASSLEQEREKARQEKERRERVKEQEKQRYREREERMGREQREKNKGKETNRERDRENVTSSASSIRSEESVPVVNKTAAGKKRKAEAEPPSPAETRGGKRPRLSPETLRLATDFKRVYSRYADLHHKIQALDNPPDDDLANLLEMRKKLQGWKNQINSDVRSMRMEGAAR